MKRHGKKMTDFPHLFMPLHLGALTLKNRIVFGSHATTLGHDGCVTDALIAYHEARARGGVALIILEGATVHASHAHPQQYIYLGRDECIPGLTRLVNTCHANDCPVFGQLYHPGRAVRISVDGSRPVPYGPSEVPDERYRLVPHPLDRTQVWEIITAYADAAGRLAESGCDGVEILASMGYLIAQFLNPRTNLREDEFGGSFDNRLRLLREILLAVRARVGDALVLGMRISGDELDDTALQADEVLAICEAVDSWQLLDYFNVIAGSSASPRSWVHVFPPMAIAPGYVAPYAAGIRRAVSKPVIVGGRINQPQVAEAIIADGQADMCALVRALICDPEFAVKAQQRRSDDIRACIGCNQACVGHRLSHHAVSCIQHPESGRELRYGAVMPATESRHVMVVGGGPAGMKAALVAAERGHRVALYERQRQLGGQVLLAQLLPGRAEFGGAATNLTHALATSNVSVHTGTEVDRELIERLAPDVVIVATGAVPRHAAFDGVEEANWVDAWEVVAGRANVGASVVLADKRCDWIGLGVAQKLAEDGCRVRLAVNGIVPGELIQPIVRDLWIGELHRLGVDMIPYLQLYGADADSVVMQHSITAEAVTFDEVDTLVVVEQLRRVAELASQLEDFAGDVHVIGDALSPRTVEEAVLEGMQVAHEL